MFTLWTHTHFAPKNPAHLEHTNEDPRAELRMWQYLQTKGAVGITRLVDTLEVQQAPQARRSKQRQCTVHQRLMCVCVFSM